MGRAVEPIRMAELADNLEAILDHVVNDQAEVVVETAFSIDTGEVIAGALPPSKARLVQAWIEIHREELLADWRLAVNGEEVFKIEPLK